MNTNFINEYNTLPPYIASTVALGIGTYRVYMTSASAAFTASTYGINRAWAIDCVTQTVFAAIQDRTVGTGTSSLPYAGASTGSQLLVGVTIPAGKMLLGDFNYIRLTSGLVIIYGL